MRPLLCGAALLALIQCATPSWNPPRSRPAIEQKKDAWECDREAMERADDRAKEHQVELGDRWYPEAAYGRCLEARGWTKGVPVGGACGARSGPR